MIDRTSKILLATISLALWPSAANAQTAVNLDAIVRDLHVIYAGTCINKKVC